MLLKEMSKDFFKEFFSFSFWKLIIGLLLLISGIVGILSGYCIGITHSCPTPTILSKIFYFYGWIILFPSVSSMLLMWNGDSVATGRILFTIGIILNLVWIMFLLTILYIGIKKLSKK